ncbi:hypothetical protein [Sporomusa sp. KB1]|jgi:DNA-binding NarL/FixJ family response regulator|nr:hypothetical protein [Sporomusa sp. KB1]
MQMTVFIIEDAKFMREVLKQTLTRFGYRVVGEASDGKEGVTQ